MKILVVEDDTTLALVTRRVLRGAGYDVTVAADAVTGVAAARDAAPDAVILDVGLPAGGGLLVLQRLRMNPATADVPVLVVTGGTGMETQAALERLGVDRMLTKPVAPQDLLAAVGTALTNRVR